MRTTRSRSVGDAGRTIAVPVLQPQASAKAGMLETVPLTRNLW